MNASHKTKIKEIYYQHPEFSAKHIARMMLLPTNEVISYLRSLGYTANRHEAARQAVKAGKKPTSPMKFTSPQVERQKAECVPNNKISKVQPEIEERKRLTYLYRRANNLLRQAEEAAQKGDIDNYCRLCKEHEIAARAAEAYKKRGSMSAQERNIGKLEYKYEICR